MSFQWPHSAQIKATGELMSLQPVCDGSKNIPAIYTMLNYSYIFPLFTAPTDAEFLDLAKPGKSTTSIIQVVTSNAYKIQRCHGTGKTQTPEKEKKIGKELYLYLHPEYKFVHNQSVNIEDAYRPDSSINAHDSIALPFFCMEDWKWSNL
ncbi:hypothetical protein VNO77_30082 [Canavalia gladiata]|uniref:Uncharacterized protein n=1 Tax=Canavalia gladiata TaxID=3824 RepID=A0AAN9KR76_CANGL